MKSNTSEIHGLDALKKVIAAGARSERGINTLERMERLRKYNLPFEVYESIFAIGCGTYNKGWADCREAYAAAAAFQGAAQ